MIGQFRKELVSTDWINSRFHPENCFWAFNHIYHARNSLALWFVKVLCVALNIIFVHSMYILLFIRKFCHWRQRMHKEVFFFYSAELTINVHVNGRHILVFCQKKKSFEQQVNEWIITIEIIGKTYFLWIFESLVA